MAHGHRDWGATSGIDTVYKSTDVNELAARMGGVNTYRRSGNVVFIDNFADGAGAWYSGYDDDNKGINLIAGTFLSGGYCMGIKPDDVAGQEISPTRRFYLTDRTRIGLEASATIYSPMSAFLMGILYIKDGEYNQFGIRYDLATLTWQYLDETYTYTPFGGVMEIDTGAYRFETFKVVFDLVAREYVALYVNGKVVDMAGYNCYAKTVFYPDQVWAWVGAGTSVAPAVTCLVDNVIVTQNEP